MSECNQLHKNENGLGNEKSLTDSKSILLDSFIYFANKWDEKTERVLDQLMCTDTCPCFKNRGYISFQTYPSELYKKRGRVFKADPAGSNIYQPFVWSNSTEDSFGSFAECLEDWEQRAESDDSIDIEAIFEFVSDLDRYDITN